MSKLSESFPSEEQLQNRRKEGFLALQFVSFNMDLQEGEGGPRAREGKSNKELD